MTSIPTPADIAHLIVKAAPPVEMPNHDDDDYPIANKPFTLGKRADAILEKAFEPFDRLVLRPAANALYKLWAANRTAQADLKH